MSFSGFSVRTLCHNKLRAKSDVGARQNLALRETIAIENETWQNDPERGWSEFLRVNEFGIHVFWQQ